MTELCHQEGQSNEQAMVPYTCEPQFGSRSHEVCTPIVAQRERGVATTEAALPTVFEGSATYARDGHVDDWRKHLHGGNHWPAPRARRAGAGL